MTTQTLAHNTNDHPDRLHAYWLNTTPNNKRAAAKILRKQTGFIGLYPNSMDSGHMLVAIFSQKNYALLAQWEVETNLPIGGTPTFVSRVEDCRTL